MKTQRYSTAVLALLVAAAISGLYGPLLAAEGNAAKPEQEQKYIAILRSDAPLSAKARACEELALIGAKNAVPVLAELLDDEILSDYARFALEPIEHPTVDDTFRQAIDKLKGRLLAGLINSIGARRDPEAAYILRDVYPA